MNFALALGQLSDRLTMRFLDHAEVASISSLAKAEELSIIRQAQLCAVMSLCPAMMIANICSAFALVLLVWGQGSLIPTTCIWGVVVLMFSGYGLLCARRFARAARRPGSNCRAPGKL